MEKMRGYMKQLFLSETLSADPHRAWEAIKRRQRVEVVTPLDPGAVPISPDKVRFVCLSDTHNRTNDLQYPVPEGDVLLHAGDFTSKGSLHEAKIFNEWLGTLPHPHKIVISGNHELLFDNVSFPHLKVFNPNDVLTNATSYLHDSGTSVYGIKIYGTP